MSLLFSPAPGSVGFVLHPTDLSQASERAFDHALAFAIRNGAHFTLLHAVGRRATDNWPGFPSVRARLARWREAGTIQGLEDRIRQSSISKLEVQIRNPVVASKQYIEHHPVDMIVLATEGRTGLARLLKPSLAEKLARETKLMTLFVPEGGRDFVRRGTGRVTLRRILIPVHPKTDPTPAMSRAVHAAALLDDPSLEITLLHVGPGGSFSQTDVPDLPFCRWNVVQRGGDVVDGILAATDEFDIDAIYMPTAWSKAPFGRLEGGVTEAILAHSPCPVATIPVV
ncbi:MAG: universal stress protein [Gemmatimonadota bacterium]